MAQLLIQTVPASILLATRRGRSTSLDQIEVARPYSEWFSFLSYQITDRLGGWAASQLLGGFVGEKL
jgi:hypothetical protein